MRKEKGNNNMWDKIKKKGGCGKNRYGKLKAMLILSRINSKSTNKKRQECRKYWCNICKAFHLTKMKIYK
jgi:hypothetical protein